MAMQAAMAAECAGLQGRFWQMHRSLFATKLDFDRQGFEARAEAVGVDVDEFRSCLDEGVVAKVVNSDSLEGAGLGVRGTPVFLVGKVLGNTVTVSKRVSGAQPTKVFKDAIDELLSTK